MNTQNEIFQKIGEIALSVVEDGWSDIVINYEVENDQSRFSNTYLVGSQDEAVEKSLPYVFELELKMRDLQEHLSQQGKELFSSCRLHISSSGSFEAKYGYEKVDWDDLVGKSNFGNG